MALDSLEKRRTPERRSPLLGGIAVEHVVPALLTISGTTTLTAAQLLKKLLFMNCTSGYTVTLPTADLLAAAMPGIAVGDLFEVQAINHGSGTCTLAMGTGITNYTSDSEVSVLTVATHQALRFALVCTAVADPSDPTTSNTFDFHGYGVTSAATA